MTIEIYNFIRAFWVIVKKYYSSGKADGDKDNLKTELESICQEYINTEIITLVRGCSKAMIEQIMWEERNGR